VQARDRLALNTRSLLHLKTPVRDISTFDHLFLFYTQIKSGYRTQSLVTEGVPHHKTATTIIDDYH
jgi:hypothetical protein